MKKIFIYILFMAPVLSGVYSCSGSIEERYASSAELKKRGPYIPKQSIPVPNAQEIKIIHTDDPYEVNTKNVNKWFLTLQSDSALFNELYIDSFKTIECKFNPALVADYNNDGLRDILLLTTVNGSDKKSIKKFYILAFNNGETLLPVEYFYAGNYESEFFVDFEKVTDSNTVTGHLVPNYFIKRPDKFPVEYFFNGAELEAVLH